MSAQAKYQFLESYYPDMLPGVGSLIQKAKVAARFESVSLSDDEIAELRKARSLCELAILEQWNNQETERFKALCATYFDVSSQIPLDSQPLYAVFELVKLASTGYLGENWQSVRQFLRVHSGFLTSFNESNNWDERLLITSFKALTGLITKENWHAIQNSVELIESLRKQQRAFEAEYLDGLNEQDKPFGAAELVSLYHLAKAVEILGQYLLNGRPLEVEELIGHHLDFAKEFAQKSGNITLELLFQFFEALSKKLVRNTIWYSTRGINSRVASFNQFISQKEEQGVFELLYPQKEAILEGGLLNPAHSAIVVNLPTSSGKTLIAEYRALMALNQFAGDGGWVAYIVPTRALVNQIYIQLKKDLSPIGVRVEKVSGALDLDGFEETLLEQDQNETQFDVLVTTYEKLHLMVRQGHGTTAQRPLVLVVVDEAHNIEEESRGLGLEFLLTTIKNDCEQATFLLMTPDVSNSGEIARWLAGERGKEIHLSLHWWQPNERIIGALTVDGKGKSFSINLNTLLTNKGTLKTNENIRLALFEDAPKSRSDIYGSNGSRKQICTLLASKTISLERPTVILARHPSEAFSIASDLFELVPASFEADEEVELVRRYAESELGEEFSLARLLTKRIGVHSSALPDDLRILIEDLMAKGKLQALVATTTIAQGINFPISAVIAGSLKYPQAFSTKDMPVRDFWNLAGRVGRAGQDQLGWVGIALKGENEMAAIADYVRRAADNLRSQLVNLISQALTDPSIEFEQWLFRDARWSGLLQYISHLYLQSRNLETFITQLEQKLQGSFGYRQLDEEQKSFLKRKIRGYAAKIDASHAALADTTGFSSISVRNLIGKLGDARFSSADWSRTQLFSAQNQSLRKLVGMLLQTPEVSKSMQELSTSNRPLDQSSIARLITDWVNGREIGYLASRYFPNPDYAKSVEDCTKAIFRHIAHAATWGIAAIQKMPNSGIQWDSLSEAEKKSFANLPALIHYGVSTDAGVLMRKNNVPRSIAIRLGALYEASVGGEIYNQHPSRVTAWLRDLDRQAWDGVRPSASRMSGDDYRKVWAKLAGEG